MTANLPGQSEGSAVKGLAKSGTACTMIRKTNVNQVCWCKPLRQSARRLLPNDKFIIAPAQLFVEPVRTAAFNQDSHYRQSNATMSSQ